MVLNPSIKKVIAAGPAPVLASYDWVDLDAGVGYVTYYGGKLASGAATSVHLLSNNAFTSDKVATLASHEEAGSDPYTLRQGIDFDVKFKLPKVIEGKGIFVIPHAIKTHVTVGKTINGYVNVRVRKWDGAAETEIAQASGSILTVTGVNKPANQHQSAIKVDIPKTKYKAGETLRVTVEHHIQFVNDNTGASYAIGHDPKDRAYTSGEEINWASASAVMTCQIPFQIDLG